jgi:hypothetical protein
MEEKLCELATGEKKADSQGELSADAIEEVPKILVSRSHCLCLQQDWRLTQQAGTDPDLDVDSARRLAHGNRNARPG